MRRVIVYPEGGTWEASCPSLPGCYGFGSTKEEALEDIDRCISECIDELMEAGEEIPKDVPVELLTIRSNLCSEV